MRAQATEIQFLNKRWGSLKVFKEKNHYELNNTYTFLTGECKKLRNHVPCSKNCMCVVSYEQLKTMRNADNFYILTNASSFCSGSCCHLICCVHYHHLPKFHLPHIASKTRAWRLLSSLTEVKSSDSKDKRHGFLQKGWQIVLPILPPLKTPLHPSSPFAIDKDVLILGRKGAQITPTLPHHQGGHQGKFQS